MLSLSSPIVVSAMGWPLEIEPISQNNNNNNSQNNRSSNNYFTSSEYPFLSDHQLLFSSSSSPQSQVEVIERCTPPSLEQEDPSMVKKLNHNASERDRRKRINGLYSSLRSLLPVADQTKKMSIPTTISRVLKYIPELQYQVETLTKKKEELLLRISRQGDEVIKESHQRKISHHNSAFVVSTSRLSESEASVQISTYEGQKCPLSEILICLENFGLSLLNASSFETFGGRVFYNLHFKVEKTQRLESEVLSEKLLSIYEKLQRIS